jgi:UDP-N-acetylglucosamine 3-dehydrogenase
MPETIGIGVIGCGAIAQNAHLPHYAAHPRAQIVAVADIDEPRARAAAEKFGAANVYTDYRKLLERDDIQAVSVCTPNYLHAEQTLAALQAGKDVLCEKPMATSIGDAERMVEMAQDLDKQLMIAFSHRFYPFNQMARQLIAEGKIGRPYTVRVRFAHRGPYDSWSAMSDWFFDQQRAGGGAILDMGIHALDIARFVLGAEIRTVSANLATLAHQIQAEDTATISLEFSNGALGYIETGWHSWPGTMGIEVYGSKGSMLVDYTTPMKLWTQDQGWQDVTDFPADGGWPAQTRYFVDTLLAGEDVHPNGLDGLVALRAALACYDSHSLGMRVSLA